MDDEKRAITLFTALFNQELSKSGSIRQARDNAAVLFYKDIVENEVEQARASERKELIAELKRIMNHHERWKAIEEFVKKKED
jgi:hypothetical protein